MLLSLAQEVKSLQVAFGDGENAHDPFFALLYLGQPRMIYTLERDDITRFKACYNTKYDSVS